VARGSSFCHSGAGGKAQGGHASGQRFAAAVRAGARRGYSEPMNMMDARVAQRQDNAVNAVSAAAAGGEADPIRAGTPVFRRTNLAMLCAGFSTFALLYCVQPLLPAFSRQFHVAPAEASMALSVTTVLLAVSLLAAGSLSEAWGRKPMMVAAMVAAALLNVLTAVMPAWHGVLLARALEGIALSGLPAIAMAYLSEEMHPRSISLAMGLYVSGSGLGGLAGRILTAVITDLTNWRVAVATLGGLGLVSAAIFAWSLPPSRHFRPRSLSPWTLASGFAGHFRDVGLRWLFAEGFLIMGSFVTVYNYIGYRLLAPPYNLSQSVVGTVFSVYLVGIASSTWCGGLAGKLGRHRVFWVTIAVMLTGALLTLVHNLAPMIAGIALVTFGFFGAHSVASSWIGARARQARAQAAALYLFFYYLGSATIGTIGGLFWSHAGWPGVVGLIACLLLAALAIGLKLARLPPLPAPGRPG
jgi:YNFM family putative membrane transporter